MEKITYKIDKLIRDGIPAMCEADGITLELKTLTGHDLTLALQQKIVEEAQEVAAAPSPEKTKEELADVLEVVCALCTQLGYTLADIEILRQQKHAKRGGFERGVFNTTATMSAANPARKFYEK